MPSLPTTKPLGLYQTLEFSQTILSINSDTPSMLEGFTKFFLNSSILQQASGIFHKID